MRFNLIITAWVCLYFHPRRHDRRKVIKEGQQMKSIQASKWLSMLAMAAATCLSVTAFAGEMSGSVVWVDMKNSAVLVVCDEDANCKDVQGKKGETFTMIIPDNLRKDAESWSEGSRLTVVFEDRDSGGRALKSVSKTQ
jgi:hypothetical protein